ncbi:hypothetical protein OIE68_27045 [Nocardia vinacea]|uniref:hypothetical protein n=1 Tax=Nocardia vinacea TaxID=96468 RepID=UPI002E116D0B|nr:hypothetical protein OIE68_27045 [Nocardia vinacea]
MAAAQRLSVVDEIFLRTHRGLGTPIALQGLWRTADRVDPELLWQVHAALRVGPLGRRVIRPSVPGARRSWRANTRAYPLEFTDGTIATGDLLEWADEQGANLDPEYGPGWRLSTAALDNGGSIVSLTCSHALADGRALVLAVDDALGGPSLTTSSMRAMLSPDTGSGMRSAPSTIGAISTPSTKSTAPEANYSDDIRMVGAAPGGSSTSEPMTTTAAEATSAASETNRSGGNDQVTSAAPQTNRSTENDRSTGSAHHTSGSASAIGNAPLDTHRLADELAYPKLPGRSDAGGSITMPRSSSTSITWEADRSDMRLNASLGRETRAPASEWSDARRQWSIVVRGTFRALRRGIPERPAQTASTREHGSSTRERGSVAGRVGVENVPTLSVVLQCPAADWESAAAAQGGTANSLFISLIAKMLWASGFPGETIDASLPVDTRDEPRVDNDLAMTEITIERSDTPATIREKARIAYERRMSSPGGMPEELLQVIPDRWAYALSKGAGERDILCSNIGTLPDSLRTLGPHRCIGVAARAIHPGLTTDRLPRTRLSGYLCRIADTYTLAVVSLDPAHIDTPETLRALAHETATAVDLPITLW